MKFKKISKTSIAISLVLTVLFLCGVTYIGLYAQSKDILTNPSSDWDKTPVHEVPDTVKFGQVLASSCLQFGMYKLDANSNYSLTLTWLDGSETLKLYLVGEDGDQKEYTLSNGKSITISVPKDGLYTFKSPRNRETGDMRSLRCYFLTSVTPTKALKNAQTVVYENVEMRHYEDGIAYPAHPYIHDFRTNNTSKTIVGGQVGMLVYDKDGDPLKIDWYALDEKLDNEFYRLFDYSDYKEIFPGETEDIFGGWSLNIYGKDTTVNEIAYVLFCDKEITFEDGTVWKNSNFDKWLNTYKGKTIDVKVLENYYPYVQKIVF